MGAWGLSLFQCDLDFDTIRELNEESGINKLETAARNAPKTKLNGAQRRQAENAKLREGPSFESIGGKHVHMPKPAPTPDAEDVSYSMYAKLCSDPEAVRKHLDTGTLTKLLRRLHNWMPDCRVGGVCEPELLHDCMGPGYMYCIIVACAITHGAKLSVNERDVTRKHYRDVGLMRDAVTQLGEALEGYVNGTPWDFGSKGLEDMMRDGGVKEEDQLFPGLDMFNSWAPDHGRCLPEMQRLKAMVKNQIARKRPTPEQIAGYMETLSFDGKSKKTPPPVSAIKKKTWPDNCGGCGAKTRADGETLDKCGKCRKRRYCSRDCQKQDWKEHKLVCKAAGEGDCGKA